MSASYIRRDPMVSSPVSLPILSSPGSLNANEHKDVISLSNNRSVSDRNFPSKRSSPTSHFYSGTNQNLHSPKMSPDSTLTQLSISSSNFVPYPTNNSTGPCVTNCTSATCDSFLRSALLSDSLDKQCVGSSTGSIPSGFLTKTSDPPTNTMAPCSAIRPRAMTTSNASRSGTPTGGPVIPNSGVCASAPTSTTPIKKSSRRNPWGSETYSDLISVAIRSYPDKQATLQQIYDFIITHYEYFRERSDPTSSAGWKNSIRHNLSLHDRFTKCPKSSDNTKSSYWRINPDVAAKPYVRRRACSMDTTNLKRPLTGHFSKLGNRSTGSGSHRVVPNSTMANGTNSISVTGTGVSSGAGSNTNLQVPSTDLDPRLSSSGAGAGSGLRGSVTQTSLSPLCELQHPMDFEYTSRLLGGRSSLSIPEDGCLKEFVNDSDMLMSRLKTSPCIDQCTPSGLTINHTNKANFYHYSQQSSSLLPNLCQTADSNGSNTNVTNNSNQSNGNNITDSNGVSGPISHWPGLKPSNIGPAHSGYNYGSASGASSNLYNSSNAFPTTITTNSTDQPASRCRTSGLIEQLLRSDQPATLHGPLHHLERLPDTFNTDTFPPKQSLKSMTSANRNLMHTVSGSDYLVAMETSSHLDVTRHPSRGSLLSQLSGRATNAQHLVPLHMNSGDPNFGPSHWQSYRNNVQSLSNNSGHYPNQSVANSGFLSPNSSSLQSANSHHQNTGFETSDLLNPTIDNKLVPFLNCSSASSLSPSTSSSLCSSGSWRHSLGLDMRVLPEPVRPEPITPLPTSSNPGQTDESNCPLGPVTPPNLIYYPNSGSVFSGNNTNYDTSSSYQPLKIESDSTESMCCDMRAPSCSSSVSYDTNMDPQPLYSNSAQDINRSVDCHFIEPYLYEDDCEPLELELSLELADRIVGTTAISTAASAPISTSFRCLP